MMFQEKNLPVSVLLEGEFESIFKNRLHGSFIEAIDSVEEFSYVEKSQSNKMIVISDGDIIRNEVRSNGSIYPLGYYKYTKNTLANKDFLLNCIEYLLDDSGLIETRTKEIKLRLLDRARIQSEKLKWQVINVLIPILLVILFGFVFNYLRTKRYSN